MFWMLGPAWVAGLVVPIRGSRDQLGPVLLENRLVHHLDSRPSLNPTLTSLDQHGIYDDLCWVLGFK